MSDYILVNAVEDLRVTLRNALTVIVWLLAGISIALFGIVMALLAIANKIG